MKNILLLKNSNFRLLWTSQLISQIGDKMFQLAILWWLATLSGQKNGLLMAIYMVVGVLPAILLAKKIGVLIDKHDRKVILMINDTLGCLFTLFLVLFYKSSTNMIIYTLFGFSFFFSIFQAFINPTLQKIVPEVVSQEDTESAVSLVFSTRNIANFVGAILGVAVIETLGIWGVVILNGLSYLISSVCDYFIQLTPLSQKSSENETSVTKRNIFEEIPLLKKILLGFGVINFFGVPLLMIIPLYTKKVLNGSAIELSFFEAMIWLGLILGGLLSQKIKTSENILKIVSWCLLSFGFNLSFPGLVANKYIFLFSLFFAGLSLGILNVKIGLLFQKVVDDDLKGSFFSSLQALINFCMPISYFFFGFLSDFLSVKDLCLIQGIGVLILAGYYFIYFTPKESRLYQPYQ